MTKEELEALMPTAKPADLNKEFYRDLINHTAMWGIGKSWQVNFRGHGHPVCYTTKKEAVASATAWILSVSQDGLNK